VINLSKLEGDKAGNFLPTDNLCALFFNFNLMKTGSNFFQPHFFVVLSAPALEIYRRLFDDFRFSYSSEHKQPLQPCGEIDRKIHVADDKR
jgi:hypothetical protein